MQFINMDLESIQMPYTFILHLYTQKGSTSYEHTRTLLLFDFMQRTKKGFVISSLSIRDTKDMWNCALTVLEGPTLREGFLASEWRSLGSLELPEDFCEQGHDNTMQEMTHT